MRTRIRVPSGLGRRTSLALSGVAAVVAALSAASPTALADVSTNFNGGATDYSNNFTQNHDGDPRSNIVFGATSGVQDQGGSAAGGGLTATGASIDTTVIYKNAKATLTDGTTHTVSTFVTAVAGLATGDKHLQLGFIIGPNSSFNGENPPDTNNPNLQPTAFISARLLGDNHVEFQSKNLALSTATTGNVAPTGTINAGDWLKLTFTATETNVATGVFNVGFTLEDYGPTGTGTPVTNATNTVTLPAISGLANTDAYMGFRTATPAGFAGTINFDNFVVNGTTSAVPEPAVCGLLATGAMAGLARRRRR
jgi:hypothetical protein